MIELQDRPAITVLSHRTPAQSKLKISRNSAVSLFMVWSLIDRYHP